MAMEPLLSAFVEIAHKHLQLSLNISQSARLEEIPTLGVGVFRMNEFLEVVIKASPSVLNAVKHCTCTKMIREISQMDKDYKSVAKI